MIKREVSIFEGIFTNLKGYPVSLKHCLFFTNTVQKVNG